MAQDCEIDVYFYDLCEALSPRFASLSCLSVQAAEDAMALDVMHPEWASMRIVQSGRAAITGFVGEDLRQATPFTACGPNCRAIRFGFHDVRIWSIVIRPLGWAQLGAAPASDVADIMVDGATHPAWERFRGLQDVIAHSDADYEQTARAIEAHLLALGPNPQPARAQIAALQLALRDPEVASVDALTQRLGVSRRTLERLAQRYFGYSPKLLLRRQRFLRSLASFMLAGRANWSAAIDQHYFDQAHFVRDFKRFMGMTPSEYSNMPHPVMDKVMAQRMEDLGAAPRSDPAKTPRRGI